MFGANSCSQRYSSNNKLSIEQGRSNLIHNNQNIPNNNNTSNELYLLYQTPIKQFEQVINNQNNNNTTPFHFDFNQHFGNLWSAGQIPNILSILECPQSHFTKKLFLKKKFFLII